MIAQNSDTITTLCLYFISFPFRNFSRFVCVIHLYCGFGLLRLCEDFWIRFPFRSRRRTRDRNWTAVHFKRRFLFVTCQLWARVYLLLQPLRKKAGDRKSYGTAVLAPKTVGASSASIYTRQSNMKSHCVSFRGVLKYYCWISYIPIFHLKI